MQKNSVVEIVRSLNSSGARYFIAGGLAVVAHGYLRLTADVDIILDLEDSRLRDCLKGLSKLGYRPRAPVPLDEFADPAKRSRWITEKGLKVFSLSRAASIPPRRSIRSWRRRWISVRPTREPLGKRWLRALRRCSSGLTT
jgi:hypothetical protein